MLFEVLLSFGKIIEYCEVLPLLCEVFPRFAKIIEYCQVLLMLCKVLPSFVNYQIVQGFAKVV